MSQHTPGPWKLRTSGITVITHAYSFSVGNEHDARLIAKATEMYEELGLIVEGWTARERGHGDKLNPWEEERLNFARALLREIEVP